LLADMTGAVDPALRLLARRLAGRVAIRLGGDTVTRSGGSARLAAGPAGTEGDLDLDASIDAVVEARRSGRAPTLDELTARHWTRRRGAIAVTVDHSGSMGGARLATAALAAAVVATRAPDEHCVVTFAGEATVLKGMDEPRSTEAVIDDLLALRGHGPTDLALGLRVAGEQLARSTDRRRTVVLLSDCRANLGEDPLVQARAVDDLIVLAPAGDTADADALARACGGRCVAGPTPLVLPAPLTATLSP
jgi:Mg-chelatase subunit ChlD